MLKYLWIIIKELPLLIVKYFLFLKNNLFKKKISSEKRYQQLHKIAIKFNKKINVEMIFTGLDKLPCKQSFVLTPNHQSLMDAVCLLAFMEQKTSFIAKKESKKFPIVGEAISSIDCLYLDRENLRQEIELMKKVKLSLKTENKKWIIFPEGTRSKNKDFALNEFKAGTFKMPMAVKSDIYPVAIWGSYRVLSPKIRMKKYPVYIHIFEPISVDFYKDKSTSELANYVENLIKSKVEELKILDQENLKKYLK